jgi:hypothetical protein
VRPVSVTPWLVVSVLCSGLNWFNDAALVPYATWVVDIVSVDHEMITLELVTPQKATYETIGGGPLATGEVVNMAFGDVAVMFVAFVDTTSKLYVLLGDSPLSVTEWLVTSVGSSVDIEP